VLQLAGVTTGKLPYSETRLSQPEKSIFGEKKPDHMRQTIGVKLIRNVADDFHLLLFCIGKHGKKEKEKLRGHGKKDTNHLARRRACKGGGEP